MIYHRWVHSPSVATDGYFHPKIYTLIRKRISTCLYYKKVRLDYHPDPLRPLIYKFVEFSSCFGCSVALRLCWWPLHLNVFQYFKLMWIYWNMYLEFISVINSGLNCFSSSKIQKNAYFRTPPQIQILSHTVKMNLSSWGLWEVTHQTQPVCLPEMKYLYE